MFAERTSTIWKNVDYPLGQSNEAAIVFLFFEYIAATFVSIFFFFLLESPPPKFRCWLSMRARPTVRNRGVLTSWASEIIGNIASGKRS